MINKAKQFLRDISGASGAEYAMIVAVVGLGMGAASIALGGNVGVAVDNGSGALYGMNDVPEDSSGGGTPKGSSSNGSPTPTPTSTPTSTGTTTTTSTTTTSSSSSGGSCNKGGKNCK